MSTRQLFHSLQFADVDAAMTFLRAVGFTEAAVYRDEDGTVVHAQYDWRDTGGIMFGADRGRTGEDQWRDSTGHGRCYCVVESAEDVDRIHDAALAAGATSTYAPREPEQGGRECAVTDREGNQWSFGTYAGA